MHYYLRTAVLLLHYKVGFAPTPAVLACNNFMLKASLNQYLSSVIGARGTMFPSLIENHDQGGIINLHPLL
jgi:hypothetical protein